MFYLSDWRCTEPQTLKTLNFVLVFNIKIIPWSYFYVTFNCSYKFVHFSPVNFVLMSLMILTLYVCIYYCQKLVNFYWKSGQCAWCHAMYLYKKICCSNTFISLFANKKISASLCLYMPLSIRTERDEEFLSHFPYIVLYWQNLWWMMKCLQSLLQHVAVQQQLFGSGTQLMVHL